MAAVFDPDKYLNSGEWKIAADSASSHYEKLGLRFDDSLSNEQINEAFYKRYNWWYEKDKIARSGHAHPTIKIVGPFISDAMKNLIEAKSILSDTAKKSRYDNNLREEINKRDEEQRKKRKKGLTREGDPKLEFVDESGKEKTRFEFKGMKLGTTSSVTVIAKNGGGGTLDARIKTSHPWLIVDTDRIHQSKLPQHITITVDPKKHKKKNCLGGNDKGFIEITYPEARAQKIHVEFSIEIEKEALKGFRKGFIPATALIGPAIGYLTGGILGEVGLVILIIALIPGSIYLGDKALEEGWAAGCGTFIGGAILLGILCSLADESPRACSASVGVLFFPVIGLGLSKTLFRYRKTMMPIIWTAALVIVLAAVVSGFVLAKKEREAQSAKSQAAQRTIQTTRSKLIGEWHGKIGRNKAKLFITRASKQISGKMVYGGIEENLSIDLKNNDGKIDIVLKGTSYKRLQGKGRFYLDTFYGKLSSDGSHIKGNYIYAAKRKGKWSVSKVASMLGAGRLFVKTDPNGAKIRILNIQPKFYQGMELEQGRYHVEVSFSGYKTQKKWIKLESKEDRRIFVSLMKMKK